MDNIFVIGNEDLRQAPALLNEPFTCYRCGELHPIIDSDPSGAIQAVRCGEGLFMVGLNWRKLPPPKDK